MDTILGWIGTLLGILDLGTGNYLVSLLMFALILEICLLPISIKQHKNTIKQANLRPKEMAIRKKYAGRNDQATQQKVTMEIQEMYQKEHYSPFGGCLPLLLQMPVLIALYQIVINPLRYVMHLSADFIAAVDSFSKWAGLSDLHGTIDLVNYVSGGQITAEGFKSYITNPEIFSQVKNYFVEGSTATAESLVSEFETAFSNLDALSTFNIGPINLALSPSSEGFGWLLLIPVLTFIVYFASMKINRKLTYQPTQAEGGQVGCSNNVMDITMPLMSVFISFSMPGVVGVYWIFKSILGSIKQFVLVKAMPYPTFTEEDYKAAEKEYAGKPSKKVNTKNTIEATRHNPKSLFHMDDEDYDPAASVPTPEEKNLTEKSPAYAEPMKDESDKPAPKKAKKGKADENADDGDSADQ
ncbi:MAG: membrane protein insertase YidC [Clostridia bacterium]|nr:membrane protein insertase YidC [Clostridia bacterium]